MTNIIFPMNYGKADSIDIPMMGFEAVKIGTGSSAAGLKLEFSGNWAWLPIPPEGVSTQYGQNWGEETANALKTGISSLVSSFSPGASAGDIMGGLGSAVSGLLNPANVGGMLQEYAAGKFGAAGVTGRMMQQAFMSYSGPTYREHSFSFSLKPVRKEESDVIDALVNFFRFYSSPLLQNTTPLARLYKVPHVFKIKFAPGDVGLPEIKVSALKNIDVKYGGEKYNVFKTTGKPVTVDISLTFAEMELLSNKDAKAPDNYVPSRLEPTVRFKEDAARRLRAAQAHT